MSNKKSLDKSIEKYHEDFHNFVDLIKMGKWDKLNEEQKTENKEKIKEKIREYYLNFKFHPKYSETLPCIVKYLGNL